MLREAEQLVRAGVKEILVVSQDTSAYGVDLKYAAQSWRGAERRARFFDSSAALGELGVWIRLHYVYPYPLVDEVVELMADGRILPYLDIPFQHASARILKLMKRPAAAENTLARIAAWRRVVPDITIRSTFIVGFPGETEQDFEELLDWLRIARLDRVGCFEYSPVAGAAANLLAEAPVPPEVKQERCARFMELAAEISAERLAARWAARYGCSSTHRGRRGDRAVDGRRAGNRRRGAHPRRQGLAASAIGPRCGSPRPAPTILRGIGV